MRNVLLAALALVTAVPAGFAAHVAIAAERHAEGLEGKWQGVIAVSGIQLRAALEITKKGPDTYSGVFISLDQGAQKLPLDTVTIKGDAVHFALNIAQLTWDGTINAAGTELTGKMTQGGSTIPLNFKRGEAPAPQKRPQEPTKPYPYTEVEVLYDNPSAGTKIGGTLTVPPGKGPFPAALLITGSGQQDRNETLLGHKPFLIIADYLTRHGIAVLRVDDRGTGTSTGNFAKSTTADFATDVEAGVSFLKSRAEIRHDRIGLIGHSEGGIIAPMVAARSKDVGFIVMLAGTGVDGGTILLAQNELIIRANGAPDAAVKATIDSQKRMIQIVRTSRDEAQAENELRAAAEEMIKAAGGNADKATQDKAVKAAVAGYSGPWMRYFISYDPAPALHKVTCPVLVMNGSKDLQVPPTLNLPVIETAFKESGNKDVTIKLMPGLNHLFQTCKTGSPTEYGSIEETFAPAALAVMGDWINAHCAAK